MEFNYNELENNVIEDVDDCEYYWNNPLCSFVRPYTYESYQMLKSFDRCVENSLKIRQTRKPKFCGKYSSEKMLNASIERARNKNLANKKGTQQKNMQLKAIKQELVDDRKSFCNRIKADKRKYYYEWLKEQSKRASDQATKEQEEMNDLASTMKTHVQEDIDRIRDSSEPEEVIWKRIADRVGLS